MTKTLQQQAQELVDSFKPDTMEWSEWYIDFIQNVQAARSCAHIAIDREIETVMDLLFLINTVSLNSKLSELQQIKQLIDYTE
jgi:hypothetical protein